MPETAGPRKAAKQTPQEKKCHSCRSLKFPRDAYGNTETLSGPDGVTNRVPSLRDIVKSMSRGCQICFAILKAIDTLVMLHIDGLPEPPAGRFPSPTPSKASKFPFLVYLPGPWHRLSYVSIRERKDLPVQVHVNINMLLFGIDEDKFGFGKAICRDGVASANGAATDLQFNFELFSDHLAPAPFHGILPARRVPARLSSTRRRRLVKDWIDECVKNHPHCCKPLLGQEDDDQIKQWRPRRLLDLGDNPRSSIRLIDAAGTSGSYATVSHVWKPRGSSDLVLDRDTLAKLIGEKIRWRDLPPVFQDAVVIASEQNIRYLWIHALCVVQDDVRDINLHIEQAHRIFGHSYLNIALERSTHLHETCLGTRWLHRDKGVEVRDVEIPVFKEGKPYKLYARPAVHHRDTHRTDHHEPTFFPYHRQRDEKNIPSCPLLDSADFLQEQIIAPRTLHVDTTELAWECRVETGCECRPSKTAIDENSISTVAMLKLALARRPPDPSYFTPAQLWDEIRRTYIQRSVERNGQSQADRLSSLVGLASCLQPLLNKRFAAGLFVNTSDDLASQLMWYVGAARTSGLETDELGRKRVDRGAHVPSWSWASIVTKHSYHVGSARNMFDSYGGRFGRDPDFHAHGIDNTKPLGVAPDQPDARGLHARGWKLRVSGRLITGKIAARRHSRLYPSTGIYKFIAANAEYFPPPLPPASQESTSGRKSSRVLTDLPPPPPPTTTTGKPPPFPAGDVMLDCDEFDGGRRKSALLGRMEFTWAYFLLLGRVERSRFGDYRGDSSSAVDVGLALRRAGDGKTGEFERIGVFWLAAGLEGLFGEGQVQDVVLV
ncbi:HET-domain-containing protein [Coniochaeta sp. PMI_546]|nr:HET-domain-containing protein [Coniochaeta sp. PMI_546]